MTEEVDEEEARELLRAGYGDRLREVALACTAPLYWYSPEGPAGSRVLHNATAFFVDTGKRTLGVTAGHVANQFLQDVEESADVVCQLGNLVIPLRDRLVDMSHPHPDIATFDISVPEVRGVGKRVHGAATRWPPEPPDEGKGVFFAGFPASHRDEHPNHIVWGHASGGLTATSVGAESISMLFDRDHWVPSGGAPEPDLTMAWGGVSGGPLFALVDGVVVSWRIVGVLRDFLRIDDVEMLRAAPISFLAEDGGIVRP